jgi:AcrR family transcriptional regulator
MAETATATAKAGRPRCFCEDQAVEAAMRVFWTKGYEGASLNDLTEAMGINRPSLYATFGDKAGLFLRAMERYAEGPAGYLKAALELPTAREVAEALLYGAVEMLSDRSNPRGCLSVQGIVACSSDGDIVKQAVVEQRRLGEFAIQKKLKRAKATGDLPPEANPADISRYLATVLNGLGVQAANGASKAEMTRVVEISLKALPF